MQAFILVISDIHCNGFVHMFNTGVVYMWLGGQLKCQLTEFQGKHVTHTCTPRNGKQTKRKAIWCICWLIIQYFSNLVEYFKSNWFSYFAICNHRITLCCIALHSMECWFNSRIMFSAPKSRLTPLLVALALIVTFIDTTTRWKEIVEERGRQRGQALILTQMSDILNGTLTKARRE